MCAFLPALHGPPCEVMHVRQCASHALPCLPSVCAIYIICTRATQQIRPSIQPKGLQCATLVRYLILLFFPRICKQEEENKLKKPSRGLPGVRLLSSCPRGAIAWLHGATWTRGMCSLRAAMLPGCMCMYASPRHAGECRVKNSR